MALKVYNTLLDKWAAFNTGASTSIGNDAVNYGAHKNIRNGALVEVADGRCTQVTSTDNLPIPSLQVEAKIYNKIKGGRPLLSSIHACNTKLSFLLQSTHATSNDKLGNKKVIALHHPKMNLWVISSSIDPVPKVPPRDIATLRAFCVGVHTDEVKSFNSLINFYHKTC